ncbi:MAG: bifunctional nuclease family protein [Prevotella sp.]|nr:bifunctional nuclease family protein [Bacteroides sp.]MCM1366067.1 bifunctional nuclease family protein [Prevotella sp.]MCM1436552.1 bifunctional nuclease family protein [Prevotella sp.]
MSEKIRLELLGITYNQIESGVYALILRQVGGSRRIPIIIGFPEAQAIECKLQEIVTPRPLTHDMTMNILNAFGIEIKEVFIHQLPNGIFAARLILSDGLREEVVDSRSSDAIALAIRCDAPIYTSREVLDKAGFDNNENAKDEGFTATANPDITPTQPNELSHMTDKELKDAMQKAVAEENYEEAARIKTELDNRNEDKNKS